MVSLLFLLSAWLTAFQPPRGQQARHLGIRSILSPASPERTAGAFPQCRNHRAFGCFALTESRGRKGRAACAERLRRTPGTFQPPVPFAVILPGPSSPRVPSLMAVPVSSPFREVVTHRGSAAGGERQCAEDKVRCLDRLVPSVLCTLDAVPPSPAARCLSCQNKQESVCFHADTFGCSVVKMLRSGLFLTAGPLYHGLWRRFHAGSGCLTAWECGAWPAFPGCA